MINPKAIDGFIRADRDDWRWIKKASLEELKETFADVPVHTQPYRHQWASIALGVSNPAFMYFLDMGLGKAILPTSKVLTPHGWKMVKELTIGDKIVHPSGTTTKLEGIYPQGVKDIYRVNFSDGTSTECCDEHLWTVNTPVRKRRGHPDRTLPLKEIMDDLKDAAGNCKHYIPMAEPFNFKRGKPVQVPVTLTTKGLTEFTGLSRRNVLTAIKNGKIKSTKTKSCSANKPHLYETRKLNVNSRVQGLLTEDLPEYFTLDGYTLGLLLGDGGLTHSAINFTTEDYELSDHIESVVSPFLKITYQDRETYRCFKLNHSPHYGNVLRDALQRVGAMGCSSFTKFIPERYLWSDTDTRLGVLQGLLDTDGYVSKQGTVQFSSNSDQLVDDVIFLVQSFGGVARKSSKISASNNEHFITTINLPKGIEPFRLTRKAARYAERKRKYEPTRAIRSVDFVEKKEAVCIKVSHRDGLFITNDFIVTHNTKLLLDLFMFRRMRGEAKRALVLVPNFTNIQSWVDEIQVHQPELVGIGLEGSAKQRKELLDAEGDVWIINYQGLQSLVTTTVNRRRVIDPEALEATANLFDMVAMDEIHKCKNPESLTFEICDVLCQAADFRYGLTGTPFGRNPMDLWAQFFLIDRGESLSHHPQIFKETFFDQKVNNLGFMDWEFNKKKKRLLNRMIQHRSIRYRDSECMDLPSQNFIPVRVGMGKDALKYMREMMDEIQQKAMAGDEMDDRKNAENVFMKMRTLASGFVRIYELDDDGKKTKHYEDIIFKDQPKLDALVDLIGSLPEGEKIVIFHEFIATGNMVEAALKKAKVKYLALNAQTKDKKAFLHDFREDSSITAAVVNSKSGSTGLNLQTANHMAFFESPVSPIERQQAEKRTHRGGQKKPCFYYDLITINSVDERIQEFIKEGKDLMTAIVEQKSSMLLGMMDSMVSDEKQRTSKKKKK